MFYVSMWEQSTWTSWVHTNHWLSKASEKICRRIKKHIETYVNYPFQQTTIISNSPWFPHHFRKKTPWGRFWGFNKKQPWEKSWAKTKNPSLSPGAQQTAVTAGAARDFWREDGALSTARPEPQAALTNSREVCMAGNASVFGNHLPPGFGWQKNQEPRVYWQRSWAKRHGNLFWVNIGPKAWQNESSLVPFYQRPHAEPFFIDSEIWTNHPRFGNGCEWPFSPVALICHSKEKTRSWHQWHL